MRSESGFTLIELLIAMVLSSILVGSLATAFVVGFTNTPTTSQRLSESDDAQFAAAWFAKDVRGARTITVYPLTSACTHASGLSVSKNLIDVVNGSGSVSYFYGTLAGEFVISRTTCGMSASTDYTTITRSTSGSTQPVVQCWSSSAYGLCSQMGSTPLNPLPSTIELFITESDRYSYSLIGDTRVEGAGSTPPAQIPALLTLGGPGVNVGGGAQLSVIGNLFVNSSSSSAVTIGGACTGGTPPACTPSSGSWIDIPSGGFEILAPSTIVASGSNGTNVSTFTGSGTLNVASTSGFPPSGSLSVQTGSGTVVLTYSAASGNRFTGVNSGGSSGVLSTGGTVTQDGGSAQNECNGCTANDVSPYPPTSFTPAYSDPLGCQAGGRCLPAPSYSTMSAGACNAMTFVCQPGFYTSDPSLGNGTWTFQLGTYAFERGLTVSGSTAIIQGSGVFFYIGCPSGAPGCTDTSSALTLQGGATVRNITPQLSGTYSNVTIFQARDDPSGVTVHGGSSGSSFSGISYFPAASVSVQAGSWTFVSLISQSLTEGGGSSKVTLG